MPSIDEAAKTWQMELAGRVGVAVQAARKAAGMTAVQLSQRTRDLGFPVSRAAISKIEANVRAGKLDVSELLVLAAALDVPPLALLFPDLPAGRVEMLPDQDVSSLEAFLWASGLEVDKRQTSGSRLVKAVMERRAALARFYVADSLISVGTDDATRIAAATDERDIARADVDRNEAIIRDCGGVLDA
ncbi:helix-turn-helix domain-containing protein [[Mycobacterium] zoologicum]|uniref:helix-turn-helix domain-containing protein n=1 Tax=[Mycobacterium] zoologicum TaxID=2872311 RepID=UPI002BB77A1B|nr:helix-turn-helix transcriptional regulator [Mycolicibacter sp. MYC101]MEB3062469.1 helix-turn-helix transcriptional regulator [Mycolicibacter sp. MYC101]